MYSPAVLGLLLFGCAGGQTGDETSGGGGSLLEPLRGSEATRVLEGDPNGSASADSNAFAWDLFALESAELKNSVASPYSISSAMAMLSAGAGGTTLQEIVAAMHFSSEDAALHEAQGLLLQALRTRNAEASEYENAQRLLINNDVWLDSSLEPPEAFLNVLSAYYDQGVYLAPLRAEPEESRAAINDQIAENTKELIQDLLPENSIDDSTRLVLTNTVYLDAYWSTPFVPDSTAPRPFVAVDGSAADVDMMYSEALSVSYQVTAEYTAVAIPYYRNELEMVILMPTEGTFAEFVGALDSASVDAIQSSLEAAEVELSLPKFEITSNVPLQERLQTLGISELFTADANLDLINPMSYVSSAHHQAVIRVDEEGTEAAAATAIVVSDSGIPIAVDSIVLDHPFVFYVHDIASNLVLFLGQFTNSV